MVQLLHALHKQKLSKTQVWGSNSAEQKWILLWQTTKETLNSNPHIPSKVNCCSLYSPCSLYVVMGYFAVSCSLAGCNSHKTPAKPKFWPSVMTSAQADYNIFVRKQLILQQFNILTLHKRKLYRNTFIRLMSPWVGTIGLRRKRQIRLSHLNRTVPPSVALDLMAGFWLLIFQHSVDNQSPTGWCSWE